MERATDTSATLLLFLWHRLVSSLILGHDSAFLLRAVLVPGKCGCKSNNESIFFFTILLFFLGRAGGIVCKGAHVATCVAFNQGKLCKWLVLQPVMSELRLSRI
jgi:hypothetical protein